LVLSVYACERRRPTGAIADAQAEVGESCVRIGPRVLAEAKLFDVSRIPPRHGSQGVVEDCVAVEVSEHGGDLAEIASKNHGLPSEGPAVAEEFL
jgi:hypothetical protein